MDRRRSAERCGLAGRTELGIDPRVPINTVMSVATVCH